MDVYLVTWFKFDLCLVRLGWNLNLDANEGLQEQENERNWQDREVFSSFVVIIFLNNWIWITTELTEGNTHIILLEFGGGRIVGNIK